MANVTHDHLAVLQLLRDIPGISIHGIARRAGWMIEGGPPDLDKVQRLLNALAMAGLVEHPQTPPLTPAGLARIVR